MSISEYTGEFFAAGFGFLASAIEFAADRISGRCDASTESFVRPCFVKMHFCQTHVSQRCYFIDLN